LALNRFPQCNEFLEHPKLQRKFRLVEEKPLYDLLSKKGNGQKFDAQFKKVEFNFSKKMNNE
jgi:hypothetical protein